ncbi:hypothetical protein GDO81_022325 [Engystomops pustulosus]|uniref:Uncharacterized protein n=1 Tax=Engystomops pustulosus TaxID=76066 RepID=A0AAV6YNV4_ENGPU|nr:hypothetical protein GDO81_022325 [Engystomops pustulosus]
MYFIDELRCDPAQRNPQLVRRHKVVILQDTNTATYRHFSASSLPLLLLLPTTPPLLLLLQDQQTSDSP